MVDRLVATWTAPPAGDQRDDDAFAALYGDPVALNGVTTARADLVARYRALHAAFADLAIEVAAERPVADGLTVVLRQRGRHVGPLPSPAGVVAPAGRALDVLGIDLLAVDEGGRIVSIWVVADELGRLTQLGAFGDPLGP
jgi:SnoaL-like polyketide cyclase